MEPHIIIVMLSKNKIKIEPIIDKLRSEIQEGKKMRHEFALRKFAFLTALLGGGALINKVPPDFSVNLAWLLLLVPIVAIAFDIYILTEDYRIKRAGEFLRLNSTNIEKKWEEFCQKNPNHLSSLAFAFVTLIYLLGAGFILKQNQLPTIQAYFWGWVGFVVIVEVVLVSMGFIVRYWLKRP